MMTKKEKGTESTSLWASTGSLISKGRQQAKEFTWHEVCDLSGCKLLPGLAAEPQRLPINGRNAGIPAGKHRLTICWNILSSNCVGEDVPHLNSSNDKSLKSMMVKDDGDGGGGEETKAEQHTMPGWVLLWQIQISLEKPTRSRSKNLQMFNISDDLLQ